MRRLISVAAAVAGSFGVAGAPVTPAVPVRPAAASPAAAPATPPALPRPLFGVTVDDVSRPGVIATGAGHLSRRPTTRIYFDVTEPASYYARAVARLRPVSYIMGELLDSSGETKITVPAFRARVRSYVHTLGGKVDVWETWNEVNGNWLGPYRAVAARLAVAYREVSAHGYRTALTLYENADGISGCITARTASPTASSRCGTASTPRCAARPPPCPHANNGWPAARQMGYV